MFGDEIKYICRLRWCFIIDVSDRQHLQSLPSPAAPKLSTSLAPMTGREIVPYGSELKKPYR
jgi:hypothetical protein